MRSQPELGHGDAVGPCVFVPRPMVGLDDVKVQEVSAGSMHALLLLQEGEVWSCGVGRHGCLGHGDDDLSDCAAPRRITALAAIRAGQVSAGDFHSLVLDRDGQLFSFGFAAGGRLGRSGGDGMGGGETARRIDALPRQVEVLSGTTLRQVSAGSAHNLAVGESGELFTWGALSYGRLGRGGEDGANGYEDLPGRVGLLARVRIQQASAGGSHSLAVTADGALYSWGCGGSGRLGHGTEADCWAPKRVAALQDTGRVQHAEAGVAHSVILTTEGKVLTCGSNFRCCIGHCPDEGKRLPTEVQSLAGVAVEAVATGSSHTVVQLATGELRAVGCNELGQLGGGAEARGEDEMAGASMGGVAVSPVDVALPVSR